MLQGGGGVILSKNSRCRRNARGKENGPMPMRRRDVMAWEGDRCAQAAASRSRDWLAQGKKWAWPNTLPPSSLAQIASLQLCSPSRPARAHPPNPSQATLIYPHKIAKINPVYIPGENSGMYPVKSGGDFANFRLLCLTTVCAILCVSAHFRDCWPTWLGFPFIATHSTHLFLLFPPPGVKSRQLQRGRDFDHPQFQPWVPSFTRCHARPPIR